MRLKAIPRSKAKTAYGLISDVMRAIKDEPKRADMTIFTGSCLPKHGGPACGTVGCFAGWVCMLRGIPRASNPDDYAAMKILGPDLDYNTPDGAYVFSDGVFEKDIKGDVGTLEYAKSVVARIRRFQKKNAAALRARRLS